MEDKTLACKDCAKPFVFTQREQEFFAEKGFTNEPLRCRECRQARRAGNDAGHRQRPNVEAVCAECGVTTTVPFRPRGDRPVFCHACYSARLASPMLV